MIKPQGIIAAMSTPFFPDETINEQELRRQVDRLIAAGLHGIFTLGTNGENYAMDFAEKVRVMEIVLEQAAGRVPVYVGTGCVTTKETIALTKKAAALGADCASVVSPWFAENTQEGLYQHYKAVAEATDLPVLIYNMPARTGVNVHYKTMARLSEIPNIVGIKDSSGNFDNMQRYLESCPSRISVLSGNDSLILPCLLAGGQGGISGIFSMRGVFSYVLKHFQRAARAHGAHLHRLAGGRPGDGLAGAAEHPSPARLHGHGQSQLGG